MHRTESWRWSLHYHLSLFNRFWIFLKILWTVLILIFDGVTLKASNHSLEYEDRSNAPSILRRFADYPCNRDLGTWCRIYSWVYYEKAIAAKPR